jgi:fluoroacetyl-CoA thioesterase
VNPGPPRGEVRTRTITVTDGMTARIGAREIHPIYGTVPLVGHVEEICRELLEPHLEEGEEGVGYRLELRHHAPAPVGAEITLVASVADVGRHRLLCDFAARDDGRLIATGSFEQRVVPAAEFAARIRSHTS